MAGQTKPYELAALEPSAPLEPEDPRTILERARLDAEAIRDAAREEGYAAGHAEGARAGAAAAVAAAQALDEARIQLLGARERREADLTREAVELALALAEKILSGALEIAPERVLDVVRSALRQIEERRALTILVHPDDLPLVSGALAQLSAAAGGIDHCELHAERRIRRGGAIVRTSEGELDASIETQLERAREVAMRELRGAVEHPARGGDELH
ncbi:MAG TPA: FliH/SctL family protein [Solirubrobacteraceae bacterium]|nr:FliH/SctL family protein [Solirubrobacteraceae bacterium]